MVPAVDGLLRTCGFSVENRATFPQVGDALQQAGNMVLSGTEENLTGSEMVMGSTSHCFTPNGTVGVGMLSWYVIDLDWKQVAEARNSGWCDHRSVRDVSLAGDSPE
jgi:hypothetical protein